MSTNQNTQQINVFNKGMNTDTSDAYIPSEQYRYAENLRFITDTGGDSGELRLIEGYKNLLTSQIGEILAVDSIRNLVVIIGNTAGKVNNDAEIHVWNVDENRVNEILRVPGQKWNNTAHYSTVTRWESDDNVKLYIADGIHPLMQLDISWKDDFNSNDTIKSFDGLYQTGGGNVFHGFGDIIRTSGLLKPAIVQYAYILYKKNGGRSNISPSTQPISLYSDSTIHRGLMDNSYTDVGLIVNINEQKSNRYDKILVYRITYSQQGLLPNIDLIIDDNLGVTGNYTFTDTGQDPIESGISFAEFVAQDYMEICPQYIESKNDYLFAGNFTYYKRDDVLGAYENWDAHENVSYEFIHDFKALNNNHSGKRSLQRGEQYRYGIVLYDKYGNKWPAKWIDDITVKSSTEDNPVVIESNTIYTRSVGLEFSVNNLDKDLFPYYEIVRVSRGRNDKKTIAQGLIGKAMYSTDTTYYPSGLITMGVIQNQYENDTTVVTTNNSKMLLFCSPDISYGNYINDILDSLSNADLLELKIDYEATTDMDMSSYDIKGDAIQIKDYYDAIPTRTKTFTYKDVEELEILLHVISITDINYNIDSSAELNNIKTAKIVESPEYNRFSSNEEFIFLDSIVSVGNRNFVNWSAASILPLIDDSENKTRLKNLYKDPGHYKVSRAVDVVPGSIDEKIRQLGSHPVGTGGKCLVLNLDRVVKTGFGATRAGESSDVGNFGGERQPVSEYTTDVQKVTIARIVKKNVTPYGGESTRKTSTYSSFGNYFENDGEKHDVYDGDVYILYFYYNALHVFYDPTYKGVPRASVVYIVPIETSIDMNSDCGDSYKRVSSMYTNTKYMQDKSVVDLFGYTQENAAYMYNTAYSAEPTIKINASVDIDDLKDNLFDYRVAHSQLKSNNERYDSWLQFKSADYLDVDTRYGEITNLRLFKDLMMFWQKSAVGILSVNERTMLLDSTDTNIILGNGDTLLRYDYLSTVYGMKPHQQCDAQSDTTLYWWDGYHKDILAYPGGHNVLPTKKEKTVSGYINSKDEIDKPVLAYDTKYNELLACVVDNNPLVYSEIIQQYTSVYKTPFERRVNMPDGLILFNGEKIYEWNQRDEETIKLFPLLKYVVNNNSTFVKVYDNTVLGMGDEFYYDRFYNSEEDTSKRDGQPITIKFNTLRQESTLNSNITDREYDLRFAIPRNSETTDKWNNNWGERMRGRTMTCELSSSSNNKGFSLQYIITKYRISWS